MSERIDIAGIDKAVLLTALFNASRPQGLGFLQTRGDMTVERAQDYLQRLAAQPESRHGETYFDYLEGRVLKVDIGGDQLDPRLFDRDNGPGAAQHAIERLRAEA